VVSAAEGSTRLVGAAVPLWSVESNAMVFCGCGGRATRARRAADSPKSVCGTRWPRFALLAHRLRDGISGFFVIFFALLGGPSEACRGQYGPPRALSCSQLLHLSWFELLFGSPWSIGVVVRFPKHRWSCTRFLISVRLFLNVARIPSVRSTMEVEYHSQCGTQHRE
jgi:hypothetical protein